MGIAVVCMVALGIGIERTSEHGQGQGQGPGHGPGYDRGKK